MSEFLVAFDNEQRKDVLSELRKVEGVRVTGAPAADGTVRIRTITRSLDDESSAIHAVEVIPGVMDVRLLHK
jgi:nitrate reductase NapAB chaperone NapD